MPQLIVVLVVIAAVAYGIWLIFPFVACATVCWFFVSGFSVVALAHIICRGKGIIPYASLRFDGRNLSGTVNRDKIAELLNQPIWWLVELCILAVVMAGIYRPSHMFFSFGVDSDLRIGLGVTACVCAICVPSVREGVLRMRKAVFQRVLEERVQRIAGPILDAQDLAKSDRMAVELLERIGMHQRESWTTTFGSYVTAEHTAILQDRTTAEVRLGEIRKEALKVISGLERVVAAHDGAKAAYEFALRDIGRSGSAALIQGIEQAYAMLHSDNMRELVYTHRFEEYVTIAGALSNEFSELCKSAQAYRKNPKAFEQESESGINASDTLSREGAMALLGVTEGASRDEISQKWRKAMKDYNVDQRQDLPKDARDFLENRLKRINQAKEILLPRSKT
jgi:hypothetical protein